MFLEIQIKNCSFFFRLHTKHCWHFHKIIIIIMVRRNLYWRITTIYLGWVNIVHYMDKPIFIHTNRCTFMYYMILMTMYNCTQWSPARGLDRDSIKQQRLWSPKWTRFHFWNAWSFDHHHPFRWPIFPELLEPGCWHSPMHNRPLCFSLSSQPKPNNKKMYNNENCFFYSIQRLL